MNRLRTAASATAVLLIAVLSACAGTAGGRPQPSSSPSGSALSAAAASTVTIGALPQRSSLLLHGEAPLAPVDSAMEEDLRTLAEQTEADPDDVIRDYAAQPAFDRAVSTAQSARAGFADAVFHAGEHAASELRFSNRPPQRLLDQLRAEYPRDLRIEWGEHLVGDRARDTLSATVVGIVREVARTGNISAGIDGDGRLDVRYDGSASPRTVAGAILDDARFRKLYVADQPPTEVRVTQVADNAATFD